MADSRRDTAVKNLVNLYTVVIGVALSLAVKTLIDIDGGLESVTLPPLLLFVAFIATLIPFYHGALRHLDDAYLENDHPEVKRSALIIDFSLLLLHAIGFVVLSLLLNRPSHFAWLLVVLLAIDVGWGVVVHLASSTRAALSAESKWTIINFVFVGSAIWYLVANDIWLTDPSDPVKLAVPILFACMLRSLVDYVWCRGFYFPD